MSRQGNHKGNCTGLRRLLLGMTNRDRHLFLLQYARAWGNYYRKTGLLKPHEVRYEAIKRHNALKRRKPK